MSYAFLLHTAIQRDAERVTAQEIRYMAEQLETAMGGIYSLLSQEFQLPLVSILMKRMEQANEIPKLPKGTVQPTIITGIEALGRGNDLQKLREFVAEIGNLAQINPQVVQALNPDDLIKRIAIGLGIDTDGLIKITRATSRRTSGSRRANAKSTDGSNGRESYPTSRKQSN